MADDRVELLDFPPPQDPRRTRLLVAAGVLVFALFVGGGVIVQRLGEDDSVTPTPSRSARTPTPAGSERARPTPAGATAQVQTKRIEPFLAELDLDLFARSGDRLHRIETRRRRLTTTVVTASSQGSGALNLVVGSDRVLVRAWGQPGTGYLVRDGKPPEGLPGTLASAEQVLAGPPDRLWVQSVADGKVVTRLTDLAGQPVEAQSGPSVYRDYSYLREDRRGGLIVTGVGGSYALTPDGPRRITRGVILATGSGHFLTSECTDDMRCGHYVIDRDTGDRRSVGAGAVTDDSDGALSGDGRYAALWRWTRQGAQSLTVTDLGSNETLTRIRDSIGSGSSQSLVWLPDNRLLGVSGGRIFVFDPKTRQVTRPQLGLIAVEQIALRA